MTFQEPETDPVADSQETQDAPAEQEEQQEKPPAESPGRRIPLLDEVEIRILGCLMEKQKTTPAYYPMTLNSLTSACNQKSSRDPVVEYLEKTVDGGLERLREKRLASMVSTAGGHVPKFRHLLENLTGLSSGEHAVLCVLMLRGPQTVGQLRGRTERMHKFNDLHEVQEVLNQLAKNHDDVLVAMLPRQAGRKDHRYTHLLGDTPMEQEEMVSAPSVPVATQAPNQVAELKETVARLEEELRALREEFNAFKGDLGGTGSQVD